MIDMRLYLFGIPRIEYQGSPIRIERRKALALAIYLALSQQPLSRDVAALPPERYHDALEQGKALTLESLVSPFLIQLRDP